MWFGSDVVTSIFDDMGTDDFSQFIASCAYAFPYVSITVTQTFFSFSPCCPYPYILKRGYNKYS